MLFRSPIKKDAGTFVGTGVPKKPFINELGQKVTVIDGADSLGNFCDYETPAVTAALETIDRSVDPAELMSAWRDIAAALAEDVTMLVLYFVPVQVAFDSNTVAGIEHLLGAGDGPFLRDAYVKQG